MRFGDFYGDGDVQEWVEFLSVRLGMKTEDCDANRADINSCLKQS